MKKNRVITLFALLGLAIILIIFSESAKQGATNGLALAESTIIPSLLPLLIIFLLIMKSSARDILAKCFGGIADSIFHLPRVCFPAIFLGLVGGYPTGAILTRELYINEEIDSSQARRIMAFNFSGGCGFIITAIGSTLHSTKAGILLFISCTLSSVIVGTIQSINCKRCIPSEYSYHKTLPFSKALGDSVSSAISSVLTITAYIVLFSAICEVVKLPSTLTPLLEITNGICKSTHHLPLALISAYLTFGGLCIHLQLFGYLKEMDIHYFDFLVWRIVASALSFIITKSLAIFFPIDLPVSYTTNAAIEPFSMNLGLSILLIIGCFVLILDLNTKRKVI